MSAELQWPASDWARVSARDGVLAAADEPAPDSRLVFDDPDEWLQFSRPLGPDSMYWESQLRVTGMHCVACALTIEQALSRSPGVQSVRVSSASGRASVVWSAQLTRPSQWLAATDMLGYRLAPDLDHAQGQEARVAMRWMLWRWLVAGFCMMQVMMYAYPAYIAQPGTITPDIEQLLRWASWVLSLPVLLFSAQPFFRSAWRDLRQFSISMDLPVSLALLITFGISSAATFEPGGWWGQEVYFDSLTMFVFFLLTGRWLELRLRERTAGSLDALMERLPLSVERRGPDGRLERVAVRRLRLNDVVRVLPGQAFPADGCVLEGLTHVDESLISGEARPLARGTGSAVLAGSYNLQAPVLMRVEHLGPQTRYGQIVALMRQAAVDKPRLALLADRLARPFLAIVLLLALGAVVYGWPEDPARAVMAAVAVLVVTCPCALSLATPSAMLAAAGSLAQQGVLLRRLQSLEALQSIDTVIFDKTGTLTQARLQVGAVVTAQRPGWHEARALQLAAALAQCSLHPVSQALVRAAQERQLDANLKPGRLSHIEEVPGQGLRACWQDPASQHAPMQLRLGRAGFCGQASTAGSDVQVFLSDEQGLLASFDLQETVRPGAKALVDQLQRSGLDVLVLSGDQPGPVRRLAQALGLRGDQVRGLCSPKDKLMHLHTLQSGGHRVLMLGDGLNDGPVLAQADVSLAVGPSVPLAQAQADMVLPSGRIEVLTDLLRESGRTMRIVKQNLAWAALYNALCIPLAWMGWLPAWVAGLGMALSSLLVVLNAARLSRSVNPVVLTGTD